jgi:hypothetical protein
MAKNLTGDLQVVSANRLTDGVVVFLDDAGLWTVSLAHAAVAEGKAESFGVIDPFLVAVSADDEGNLEPVSLREKIRASGLTFGTIAAEAVRYA